MGVCVVEGGYRALKTVAWTERREEKQRVSTRVLSRICPVQLAFKAVTEGFLEEAELGCPRIRMA